MLTQEDLFVGKQILIDSDRLVFNGRKDAIFSSADLFLFKTEGEFHINTRQDTFINTPKIFKRVEVSKFKFFFQIR